MMTITYCNSKLVKGTQTQSLKYVNIVFDRIYAYIYGRDLKGLKKSSRRKVQGLKRTNLIIDNAVLSNYIIMFGGKSNLRAMFLG